MERRRRFVPWSDRLEGRQLLTAAPATPAVAPAVSVSPTSDYAWNIPPSKYGPFTPQDLFVANVSSLRQFRIAQLPVYLQLVNTERTLDDTTVKALQADLEAVRNRLTAPPQALVSSFIDSLRDALTTQSITPDHARVLNDQFGKILESSGAPPDVTQQFQADMNRLTRQSVNGPNPAIVAANDYAVITQYVLAIGRKTGPMTTGTTPQGPLSATLNNPTGFGTGTGATGF